MIFLLCLSQIGLVIYVHCMQRAILRAGLLKYHSKTFLRKLRKNCSLWDHFTGFYLIHGDIHKKKVTTRTLIAINLNLLSTPFLLIAIILFSLDFLSYNSIEIIVAILCAKDFAILTTILFFGKFWYKKY